MALSILPTFTLQARGKTERVVPMKNLLLTIGERGRGTERERARERGNKERQTLKC